MHRPMTVSRDDSEQVLQGAIGTYIQIAKLQGVPGFIFLRSNYLKHLSPYSGKTSLGRDSSFVIRFARRYVHLLRLANRFLFLFNCV
jgi:hypothetical protein